MDGVGHYFCWSFTVHYLTSRRCVDGASWWLFHQQSCAAYFRRIFFLQMRLGLCVYAPGHYCFSLNFLQLNFPHVEI